MKTRKRMKIHAKDVNCYVERCKEKAVKWLIVDPDIKPIAYCKKHLTEFKVKIKDILGE